MNLISKHTQRFISAEENNEDENWEDNEKIYTTDHQKNIHLLQYIFGL
jgi:hypothetical protein